MARKRRTDGARRRESVGQRSREWVGGWFSAPFHITEGPEPYRPILVAWIEVPAGLVVGHEVSIPGEDSGALGRTLTEAMRHPLIGPARRPSAIRVADAELAAEVKSAVGDLIPVTIAATPELDQLADRMFESMRPGTGPGDDDAGGDVEQPSYFENGRVSPEAVADLFAAAKLLRRVAPWQTADDQQVLRLDIPHLEVEGACVSIIGALGDSLGLLIFPSLAGFEAFLEVASNPRPDSPCLDLGTSWLAFNLVPGTELPAAMRREVAEHGWPVADETSYPQVQHPDRDGLLRPLTERDVRIASACATSLCAFFVTNRGAFETEDCEPICQSFSDDEDRIVRFTLPYEAFDLFDVDADAPEDSCGHERSLPGRNDPCHCGSGKKYKKCHLGEDRSREQLESAVAELHRMDGALVMDMCLFAAQRFEDEWSGHRKAFADPMESGPLAAPWSVHHFEVRGLVVRDWFLEERSAHLTPLEREWLSAQEKTWLSIWEVVDVRVGESLTVEDRLTGEVRLVQEKLASTTLVKRDTILGRVTAFRRWALLCGVHPRPLPPADAAEVVRRVRSRLRRKRAVPVDRLQKDKIGFYLIRRWEEAVAELDRRRAVPPDLRNTDGDPLVLTVDHFEVNPADRQDVEARLSTLPDVELPERDDDESAHFFVRPGDGVMQSTLIGVARLSRDRMRIESNSRQRADRLRKRIEDVCGGIVRHRAREHPNPLHPASRAVDKAARIQRPEFRQLELDFKEQHYADWPDHPLPALDGRTPREAVQTKEGRDVVDLLLKEMENLEGRAPAGSRFAFATLRRELGLEP
jgi:hypothetical protein